MTQKYKIFINEKEVILTNKKSTEPPVSEHLLIDFNSDEDLIEGIEQAETNEIIQYIEIFGGDIEALHQSFFSLFKLIIAGGGLVVNQSKEILWIFRRDKWDLPKGKIKKSEKVTEGAIREVEEETGLSGVSITRELLQTFHVYWLDGVRILKQTYWYEMAGDENDLLVPEVKEDIGEVCWVKESDLHTYLADTYGTIREVFYNRNFSGQ